MRIKKFLIKWYYRIFHKVYIGTIYTRKIKPTLITKEQMGDTPMKSPSMVIFTLKPKFGKDL